MVTQLTEESIKEFIKQPGRVVIKGYMEGCGFCTNYAPIFADVASDYADSKEFHFGEILLSRGPSEFREAYMKPEPGKNLSAPCTFIFENGEYKTRHHGIVTDLQLEGFIKTLEMPGPFDGVTDTELKAMVYDAMVIIETAEPHIKAANNARNSVNQINLELQRRHNDANRAA